MSRGESILQGVRSNPHVCQLQQQDQPNDAIFFVFDFTTDSLKIARAGRIDQLRICRTLDECVCGRGKGHLGDGNERVVLLQL